MSVSPPARTIALQPSRLSSVEGGHPSGSLLRSFWMAGYEGADHINPAGLALSMNESTEHWQRLAEDYALLAEFGLRTVRESVGWRVTETQGTIGLRRIQAQAEQAAAAGLDVIWTVMHYGWPTDVDLLSPEFVNRLGTFSAQVARALRAVPAAVRYYQPVNEISFLSWALSQTGMMRHPRSSPDWRNGHAVKRQLVRAALRACDAIASVDPAARFMHSDPIMDVVPPLGAGPLVRQAAQHTSDSAFEAWDMLCGQRDPHLGGAPHYLDVVGVNYYHDNHREWGTGLEVHWHLRDPRRKPLEQLLAPVYQRYQRPMLLAETSHVGDCRPDWLDDIAAQVLHCREQGLPIEGVCLFPILDRPDWGDLSHWHHSGLWDIHKRDAQADSASGVGMSLDRTLCRPYADRLRYWQQRLPGNVSAVVSGAPDAARRVSHLPAARDRDHLGAQAYSGLP